MKKCQNDIVSIKVLDWLQIQHFPEMQGVAGSGGGGVGGGGKGHHILLIILINS